MNLFKQTKETDLKKQINIKDTEFKKQEKEIKKLRAFKLEQQTNEEKRIQKEKNKEVNSFSKKSFIGKWFTKSALTDRFNPTKTLLVEMYHTNGTTSHFIVKTNVHKFEYNNRSYIVDEDRKIYCNSTKLYMLRYHESFALPFSVEVSGNELKKNLPKDEDINEISTAYNPYVLKDILKFEYAKGVIQGAEIHEFLKKVLIVGIITMVISFGHLILSAYKGGWI